MKTKEVIAGINYGLRGTVQAIVMQNGVIVREYPVQRNMILNLGLDLMANYTIGNLFAYAAYGTGVIPPGQYDTGLGAEATGAGGSTRRTNTYLIGAGNCQTKTVGNVTTLSRTYDFATEGTSQTYTEVGFSNTSAVGGNLFARALLLTPVGLVPGQQLRLRYSVDVTLSPTTPLVYGSSPIIGWPTATGSMQLYAVPVQYINTSGAMAGIYNDMVNPVDGYVYSASGEPGASSAYTDVDFQGGAGRIGLITGSGAHPAYPAAALYSDVSLSGTAYNLTYVRSTYVNGTYTRDKYTDIAVGNALRSDWRGFYMYAGAYASYIAFRYLTDIVQEKDNLHTLRIGFRQTWGRLP